MPYRALFIDVQMPQPDRHASSVRSFQMLRMLRDRGFAVDLAVVVAPEGERPQRWADSIGVTVLPWIEEHALRAWLGEHAHRYALILIAWTTVARRYIATARAAAPGALIVFDSHDVNHVREYREAKVTGNLRTLRRAMLTKGAEMEAMGTADVTIAITDDDAATLRALHPRSIVETVTMWAEPAIPPRPARDAPVLLFVGHYGAPANHDAAFQLAHEILPRVRARLPEARLVLAGSDPNPELRALAGDAVVVPGWLPDLGGTYAEAGVFVAPLRFGSGLKGKLLEAIRHRVPIVASPVAAEGVGAADGREILCADGADATADAVVALLNDPVRATRMTEAAAGLIARRYGRATVERQLDRVLARRPRLDMLPAESDPHRVRDLDGRDER